MKKLLIILFVVVLIIFGCKKKDTTAPSDPVPADTPIPADTLTFTETETPEDTLTPTVTSTPDIHVEAVFYSQSSVSCYVVLNVNGVEYDNAEVTLDNVDNASPADTIPWNAGQKRYILSSGLYWAYGETYEVSVKLLGLTITAKIDAAGSFTFDPNGAWVAFGYPGETEQGRMWAYNLTDGGTEVLNDYTITSPYMVPTSIYTAGNSYRIIARQGENIYASDGVELIGANNSSVFYSYAQTAFEFVRAANTSTPTDTVTDTPTDTPTATFSPTETCTACAYQIGYNTDDDNTYYTNSAMLCIAITPSSGNLNVNQFCAKFDYDTGTYGMGVYADSSGQPGTLITEVPQTQTVNGWSIVDVWPPNTSLLYGSTYWICICSNNRGPRGNTLAGPGIKARSFSYSGSMPADQSGETFSDFGTRDIKTYLGYCVH